MNNTTIGVDLAKDVIQVCIFSQQKVISNAEMSFADSTIIFKPVRHRFTEKSNAFRSLPTSDIS